MNKNNYYYEKLIQCFLYSEVSWREIVDPKDPNENIFCKEFLLVLHSEILKYRKKQCLEDNEYQNLHDLLNDLRFEYPYKTKTERKNIFDCVNEMIKLANEITGQNTLSFYYEEYKKRCVLYHQSEWLSRLSYIYYCHCLIEEEKWMKVDLQKNIFYLKPLFQSISEMDKENLDILLLSDYTLRTINIMSLERPDLLLDQEIRSRYISILEKNKELLQNQTDLKKEDLDTNLPFRIKNHIVLEKLKKY